MNLIATIPGDNEMVELVQLDPHRVRIWEGNARRYEDLTEAACSDLIASIEAEGGLHIPVVVRKVVDDPDHDYELIVGVRRHFAVVHLRSHHHSGIWLLARVMNLADEVAFRLADTENRARQDVSDLERARNYVWALDRFYGGKQATMADMLGVSKGWLSKMLAVGRIPDEVIKAFNSPNDLHMKPAYELATALADEGRRAAILRRAKDLAEDQLAYCDPIPSSKVMASLLHQPQTRRRDKPVEWRAKSGAPAITMKQRGKAGLTIRVHANSGAGEDELVMAFRKALAYLPAYAEPHGKVSPGKLPTGDHGSTCAND